MKKMPMPSSSTYKNPSCSHCCLCMTSLTLPLFLSSSLSLSSPSRSLSGFGMRSALSLSFSLCDCIFSACSCFWWVSLSQMLLLLISPPSWSNVFVRVRADLDLKRDVIFLLKILNLFLFPDFCFGNLLMFGRRRAEKSSKRVPFFPLIL